MTKDDFIKDMMAILSHEEEHIAERLRMIDRIRDHAKEQNSGMVLLSMMEYNAILRKQGMETEQFVKNLIEKL